LFYLLTGSENDRTTQTEEATTTEGKLAQGIMGGTDKIKNAPERYFSTLLSFLRILF